MRVRALWRLDQFFALPPESDSIPGVAQHFRRNFLVNSADGMLWLFGASFVSVNAILPVYATKLTDSPIVIGLIPALTDAGWFLPQLFMAPFVERMARKLTAVGWFGALERLPYLALALAALWLPTLTQPLAIVAFLVLILWKSLASGLVAMPWQELIATVIPVSHRGRFFGISHLAGQLLGVAGASAAIVILVHLPYPRNYALCFFIAFLSMSLSYMFLMLTIEPKTVQATAPRNDIQSYLKRLGSILRENANFRTFLVSRVLAYFGGMAYGFMAVYGVQRFNLSDAQAAVFTAILFGSGVLGYPLWGSVGDRLGHKRVLELSGGLWLVALLVALLAQSAAIFYCVFALMGFGSAGGVLGDLSIAMEFGPDAERPTYIGLTRTITGPAAFIAPLAGGAIITYTGYPIMFVVSLGFAILGLGILWLRVIEPRRAATINIFPSGVSS
ncbi:MAG TPA: MFS transporter [Anaerolineae bacterium]|nr:MFS transporter [Anaerolineae bacterium]